MTAATILKVIQFECDRLPTEARNRREAARRVKARRQEFYVYLSNNFDALANYGQRYRNGLPVSSSRAEGCVDDIGNARMGKRRRMRWSPQGAHRCAVTRVADLDRRLSVTNLTTSEIPHLIARLLLRPALTVTFIWEWSRWRRQHQTVAALSHRKAWLNAQL